MTREKKNVQWSGYGELGNISQKPPSPSSATAEKSCLNCRFHNSPTYHDKMWCRDCQQLNHYKPQPTAEGAEQLIRVRNILQDFYRRGDYELEQAAEDIMRIFTQQPTAEGAEEILASLIESLGEPDNSIHDHSYEIRPLTVNGKCEWWMFHNGVGSGEPLAQWLQNFATLHAQRIADKMVGERLREELIAYDKWATRHLNGSGKIFTAEGAVDEYLKSR